MTSKLDPEEVEGITSRVFDGVRQAVAKYEGFIERFAGDGVLALFGVPRAHEAAYESTLIQQRKALHLNTKKAWS